MTKEKSNCLGKMFLTFIQNDYNLSVYPFEKDFKDIEEAYIETENESSGIYVLLKTDRLMKVKLDVTKKEIIIDTIILDKIVSIKETINNEIKSKLKIKEVTIKTIDGDLHKFSRPRALDKAPKLDQFILDNIDNYMSLFRKLI